MSDKQLEYVGFWARTGACVIDSILIIAITFPLLVAIYGWEYFDPERSGLVAGAADFLISWLLPFVVVIAFWTLKQATPGKMAVRARIVDAYTGRAASTGQLIGRYLAYIPAMLPLGLGLLWVAFDSKKQGWHDKLASTVVVRERQHGQVPVQFGEV